ncbi:multisubstrate pseudouridine synthase 7 [Emydomyces testavorans]|uniref:Multisubstrate pseudouridine synthase 7 n=1 Tax=Emydomyces testavorans TaxID=2070801 RepID=A0AAF0DAE7_9EURO|nr:multisubstrate pseudouridine synthase 7 [Emydomyces testavorans]
MPVNDMSQMKDHLSGDESRRKRVKLADDQSTAAVTVSEAIETPAAEQPTASRDAQALKEAEVGITEYVCPNLPGFSGILKKRYTDFLVNEILPSGQVLHLRDLEVPASFKAEAQNASPPQSDEPRRETVLHAKADSQAQDENASETVTKLTETPAADSETAEPTIPAEDQKLLEQHLGPDVTQKVLKLYGRALAKPNTRAGDLGRVRSDPVPEKTTRTTIHQALRRIFSGRIESSTESDNALLISSVPVRRLKAQMKGGIADNRRGKLGWSEVGGEHLHFTIYKENKDTMEVVNFLASQMKVGVKAFKFAGTKDRRGVTVQRASAFRVDAARLANMNRTLRYAAVGDFKYEKQGLELGELGGNEFVITLRECQFPIDPEGDAAAQVSELITASLRNLREKGYFNYYGLQRFGTFATRTDTIGVKMLQSDFKGACECILHYSPASLAAAQGKRHDRDDTLLSSDDISRAEAIYIFESTGQAGPALAKMPRKFSGESNIIKHLSRKKNDYMGALQTIPRNLRLMYVHAYQSLVWNYAVGERWRVYGSEVVAGDLVLVNEFQDRESDPTVTEDVDADGEAIVLPDTRDSAVSADSVFERARALTAEEAASGKYTIFDIVLPLPGYDIIYPPNKMTDFYKSFMGSELGGRLDPFDMRRKWKETSLSGSYRKIVSRLGPDYSFEVKRYVDDNEQFVKTDLERIREKTRDGQEQSNGKKADAEDGKTETAKGDKLAVVIKFQLGVSQYATMALRELMKTGGARAYQPEYMSGR